MAEATGQSARFLKIYEEYKKAPEVTRKRMYLETMERIMSGTDKIIVDTKSGQGVIPFLPLRAAGKTQGRRQLIARTWRRGGSLLLKPQRAPCGSGPEGTSSRSSS